MSTEYTRNIQIMAAGLPHNLTLMFAFGDQKNSVVWKTIKFPAEATTQARFTYHNQLCFMYPEVHNNHIVGSVSSPSVGQQVTLITKANQFLFMNPIAGTPNAISAENGTAQNVNLAIGFALDHGEHYPVRYCPGIASNETFTAEFKPVLNAYVTGEFREGEILPGGVEVPKIWSQNLAELDESTKWVLNFNMSTGELRLVRA
ncbi:hypothetical protein PIIN_07165 [Serendipita indica DSM 11827]|uniref:Uncharacterized protein n=1 Tax=Serendipita indica (strain DSM 11827) TaxID=1109443 RepID=G4TPG8_SERID|nr:hypothetical protein PIIN_07165 [Serendipita indica DSM 11827]